MLSRALLLAAAASLLSSCHGRQRRSSQSTANAPSGAAAPHAPDVDAGAAEQARSEPDGIELANHQAGPSFIAVDDRFVYWTNFEDDGVLKIAKDGSGGPTSISHNDRGENKAIAVDDTAVYWGGTSLYQQSKATGRTQRFAANSTMVFNLIASRGRIYWAEGGKVDVQLKSMKADGSDIQAIGPRETQDFIFATDGSSAFIGRFTLNADDAGKIDVVSLDKGAPSLFAKTRFISKIAIDGDFVYWLEGRNVGAIKKKARTGVGDVITLTQGFPIRGPQSLVVDHGSLYWTELGAAPGQGAVGKVSKAGGDAQLIARHQIVPQAIAVDDTFAYWVNFGPTNNGTIRKISKQPTTSSTTHHHTHAETLSAIERAP